MCYSIQCRNQICVKGYGFFSFAKNMSKNIGKNISKTLSGKYSQKLLDHGAQPAMDAFKTALKRAIRKTAKATSDLTGNKIVDKITKVSRTTPQNNSKIIQKYINEKKKIGLDREITIRRYISPEKHRKLLII